MKTSNRPINGSFQKTALALLVSSALVGCSGGGGSGGGLTTPAAGGSGAAAAEQVSLSGIAIKGLLKAATVTAYSLDKSITLGTVETEEDGSYVLPNMDYQGAILVELTTNANTKTVCDAANGCAVSASTVVFGTSYAFNDANFKLTSVLPNASLAANQKLMVTPITHLAAQRIIKSGITEPAKIQGAVNATAKLLGLDSVDINTLAPVDITNPNAVKTASSNAQMYGALVGAIATLAESKPGTSVADLLENLVDDYSTDGGLSGNSADANKITLNNIFEAAGDVVTAAENKANEDNVVIDLGTIKTTIATETQEAQAAEPDAEVVEDVVDTAPVSPTSDSAKLAALLEDVSTWDQALEAASDKGIYQPFEDQLQAASDLVEVIADQSALLTSTESLVIGTEEEVYACWDNGDLAENASKADCDAAGFDGDFETETRDGLLVTGVEVTASLVELVAFFERVYRKDPTLQDTDLQALGDLTLDDAIALGYDGLFVPSLEDIEDGLLNTVTITPTYVNDRMVSAQASFTHTSPGEESATFSLSVARNETTTPTVTYQVSDVTGFIDVVANSTDDYFFSSDGGKIDFVFTDTTARDVFLGAVDDSTFESFINLLEFTVDMNMTASKGSIDGSNTSEQASMVFAAHFKKEQGAFALTNADVSIDVDVKNIATNETLAGAFNFKTAGSFEEVPVYATSDSVTPIETLQDYFANTLETEFEGNIVTRLADGSVAMFDGSIAAKTSIYDGGIALNGNMSVIDANNFETTFSGNINAEFVTLKNADGTPYVLQTYSEAMPSKVGLMGVLSTETTQGVAKVSLNAALDVDYSTFTMPELNVPAFNEKVADATYILTNAQITTPVVGKAEFLTSIMVQLDLQTGVGTTANAMNAAQPELAINTNYPLAYANEIAVSLNCFDMPGPDMQDPDMQNSNPEFMCQLIVNGYNTGNSIASTTHESTLMNVVNGPEFQNNVYNASVFNPIAVLDTVVGDIVLVRPNNAPLIQFIQPQPGMATTATADLVVGSDELMVGFDTIDEIGSGSNSPTITATLQMDTQLMGIEDGQIKISAENIDHDNMTASALFRYGNRSVSLDVDTTNLIGKDKTFITLSNADVSLKLVATCATDKNDLGVHDNSGIAACDGDLNFSGDVFIDGSDSRVATLEDRDGLPVIKFVSGDSYGVVMTPNFDFVKQ